MTQIGAAMVLAAGFGTRMGDLTATRPKPLLPVLGRALIDHTLDHVTSAGAGRAVINLHYLGDLIRTHLSGRNAPNIVFSEEQPQILDTGGGVRHALPLLGPDPFFCLNSDAVWTGPNPLSQLQTAWRPEAMDALLLLVPRDRALGYTRPGDFFLDSDGGAPGRRADAPLAPEVFTGAQILKPGVFEDAPNGAFSTNVIWDDLIAGGRLAAIRHPGHWVDVGTPAGLAEAEAALRNGAA
ncbi:MAG: nucleotidyltransferase family protein [Pseudomonadota bacterium]